MCFLLVKNFSRDPRFGNGACIFFLSTLSTGNEISTLLGLCRTDVVVDFFFWTISPVNLFSTRHKNLDPFQIKVGEKWI